MIGKIPTVLKINKQTNRPNCFLVPAFRSAIPFRTISRTISTSSKKSFRQITTGVTFAAIAVVSGVMII